MVTSDSVIVRQNEFYKASPGKTQNAAQCNSTDDNARESGASILRLRFSKTGKSIYISHLDLMATLSRALLRAGVQLKYSEGFNPHPYISVALPLPVGGASVCELADIRVAGAFDLQGIPELLTSKLPDGIKVTDAYIPDKKFNCIAWVKLECTLSYDSEITPDTISSLKSVFLAGSITVPKKSKSGASEIDVAPYLRDIEISGGRTATLKATVSAQNPPVSAAMLMTALSLNGGAPAPDFYMFTRTEIYDINMCIFR